MNELKVFNFDGKQNIIYLENNEVVLWLEGKNEDGFRVVDVVELDEELIKSEEMLDELVDYLVSNN